MSRASLETDPNLYLIEGMPLVPPGGAFFSDGLHPNNAGFEKLAESLTDIYMTIFPDAIPSGGGESIRRARVGVGAGPATHLAFDSKARD